MLKYLKSISIGKKAWFLLFVITTFMLCTALILQHGFDMQPCVLCIYQRTAILGIWFASILGMIAPKNFVIRITAIGLWIYSAAYGLSYSWLQVKMQFFPTPMDKCDLFPRFYFGLKWNEWIPSIFEAKGLCSDIQGAILGLEISQWMTGIFSVFLFISIIVLISQVVKSPTKETMFSFRKRWK
ncbi:disulfide bond formation protein DsbB [Thorsellia kenyensis]|uniref:Disulfide bond formation protein B n=1 Tax=Thorsellia kenyensis TaxID=1549888 RepID=A0ABV6C748_9GAMM